MMVKEVFVIDGANFITLEGFAKEFTEKAGLEITWNGDLDDFEDILYGGFGTPEEGFVLIWKNSALSKEKLGWQETVRQLNRQLEKCHASNRKSILSEIEKAKLQNSSTVFDWIVEIVQSENHKDIDLKLE